MKKYLDAYLFNVFQLTESVCLHSSCWVFFLISWAKIEVNINVDFLNAPTQFPEEIER